MHAARTLPRRPFVVLLLAVALAGGAGSAGATVYVVAESGGDFTSIQAALDVAAAGDTVTVKEKPTPYFEKLVFPASGDPGNGHITLQAAPGEQPVLDGTGVPGDVMILIEDRSWVKVIGFEIRNLIGVDDGSGIRVLGSGSHIELRQNRIHALRDENAMGITVYATGAAPVSDLVIDGNEIWDCEAAPSEALTLNGNVQGFAITNNYVHDVDNIGIDMIGGETDIQPDPTKVAREGVVRGNRVERARSSYGGGFAAGIYVDGGRDILIENNVVTESDVGMEIGAENGGTVTRNVTVRNNVLYANDKAGLGFGGYASFTGRVRECTFTGNTVYKNDTLDAGFGQLWIQYGSDNVVRNNLFYGTGANTLLVSEYGNDGTDLDYNLWYVEDGAGAARFSWNGTPHLGFAAYQAGTGADAHAVFADPLLVAPGSGDFHLGAGSPAVNAGDPAFVPALGEGDLDGGARVNGPRVDAGADERTTCGDGTPEAPELCDDGDLEDGDGCDANCTPTGCGNGIVTAGEACDDGNVSGGDCCDAGCALEGDGSPCSDADPCTIADGCTAGSCAGMAAPEPVCRVAGKGTLQLRDKTAGTPEKTDQLAWQWTAGAATTTGDFGDPASGATRYDVCVYDEAAGVFALRLHAGLPAGGTCGGKACWRTKPNGGVDYRDRDGSRGDGVVQLGLKPGPAGRASVKLKAKGVALAMPPLPFAQTTRVAIQLKTSDGTCFGTTLTAPAARNDTGLFKDRLD